MKFFSEFRKFIARGNVMDMAVGTIVGAAFTAIVTALSNGILKPLINALIYVTLGGNTDALEKMYTVLIKVETDGVLDLAKSIYIDWGAFISAIINFLLVAIVLFAIIKTFNTIRDAGTTALNSTKRIELKVKKGFKLTKREQKKYDLILAEKQAKEEAEKAKALEAAKPTSEELLAEIRDLLAKKNED